MHVALNTNANSDPFNSSIAFHTITIVSEPNNAGKNLTQKTVLPKKAITLEIHEVSGGTDK